MARSRSGRIVIEVDTEVKRRLYAALAERTLTLKEWFLQEARDFIKENEQAASKPGATAKGGR